MVEKDESFCHFGLEDCLQVCPLPHHRFRGTDPQDGVGSILAQRRGPDLGKHRKRTPLDIGSHRFVAAQVPSSRGEHPVLVRELGVPQQVAMATMQLLARPRVGRHLCRRSWAVMNGDDANLAAMFPVKDKLVWLGLTLPYQPISSR